MIQASSITARRPFTERGGYKKRNLVLQARPVGLVAYGLLVASFFPYITFIPTPFSMQPYPFIFGLLYYVHHSLWHYKFPLVLHLSMITLAAAGILTVFNPSINAIRSLFNYANFCLLLYCYVHMLATYENLKIIRFIGLVSVVYICVGIVQLSISPNIASCCVGNISDISVLIESGRGVSSLTPEPTFYGFFCLAFIVIFEIARHKKPVYINLIGLVFLSISSLAILCFSVYFCITFIARLNLRKQALALLAVALFFFVFWGNIKQVDLRLISLLDAFIEGSLSVASTDESIAGRLYHLIQPWKSFALSWGLPHLFSGLPNGDPRILSGFGSGIYELGIFFLPVLFTVVFICLKFTSTNPRLIAAPSLLGIIWFNANQLGMSIFIFYLALMCHHATVVKENVA